MLFILFMFFSSLSIAGAAAYLSVWGLTSIFGGYSVISVWSFVSLEIGKLIAASFAYRYWKKINFAIKTYLVLGIMGMMLITSAGIYGYFTASYQEDTQPIEKVTKQISLLQEEKDELLNRKAEMDADVASKRTAVTKKEMVEKGGAYYEELQYIMPRVRDLTKQIQKIKLEALTIKQHIGPIVYIAQIFNLPVDNAISYMVILIMFVFDPMAIVLTICTNIAIMERQKPSLSIVREEILETKEKDFVDTDYKKEINELVLSEVHAGMTKEELEEHLKKYEEKLKNRKPTQGETLQKEAITQMLNRKKVVDEIRNPHSDI